MLMVGCCLRWLILAQDGSLRPRTHSAHPPSVNIRYNVPTHLPILWEAAMSMVDETSALHRPRNLAELL